MAPNVSHNLGRTPIVFAAVLTAVTGRGEVGRVVPLSEWTTTTNFLDIGLQATSSLFKLDCRRGSVLANAGWYDGGTVTVYYV